ncbi:MAG TPA: Uma2 family endonuclease [Methylomirabilota bacterium]|jgi:Uma2 family endonuclease
MSEEDVRYRFAAGPGTLTYEDYCALPDDGLRYEIIEGFLFSEPSPRRAHQQVAANLLMVLRAHVREHNLGEVYIAPFDVILSRRTVVVPDLVFVTRDRADIVTERAVEDTPDLIIEILSPGTARRDRVAKLNAYARRGVPHYWLVDPVARTLEAFELSEGSYRLVAAVGGDEVYRPGLFPALVLPLSELWR